MIQAIKKAYPMLDEQGRSCTFPTFGSQVFSEGDDQRALWQSDKGFYADDSAKLNGIAASEYALKTEIEDFSSVTYIHDLLPDPDEDIIEEDSVIMTVTADKALDSDSLGGIPSSDYMLKSNTMSMELIYENPSTTSEFAAQSVTLSKPTTDFDLILYIMKYQAAQNYFFGCFSTGAHPGSTLTIASWTTRRRDVSAGATPTVLEFANCREVKTYGSSGESEGILINNTLNIPYRIYGIKVGGGD